MISAKCPQPQDEVLLSKLQAEQKRLLNLSKPPKVMISACLMGWPCRYDGQTKADPQLLESFGPDEVMPICPEMQGGLPVPRVPAGLAGGAEDGSICGYSAQVINRSGQDVTAQFRAGAEAVLALAERLQPELIILKQHSPSCGCGSVGGADGQRHAGRGVACDLLESKGFCVRAAG